MIDPNDAKTSPTKPMSRRSLRAACSGMATNGGATSTVGDLLPRDCLPLVRRIDLHLGRSPAPHNPGPGARERTDPADKSLVRQPIEGRSSSRSVATVSTGGRGPAGPTRCRGRAGRVGADGRSDDRARRPRGARQPRGTRARRRGARRQARPRDRPGVPLADGCGRPRRGRPRGRSARRSRRRRGARCRAAAPGRRTARRTRPANQPPSPSTSV